MNAYQSNNSHKPIISTKSEKIISDIDLNPAASSPDIVNVFTACQLKSFDANNYWMRNGLLSHNNGQFDKFISFLLPPNKHLIASKGNDYILTGPSFNNNKNTASP